MPDALEEEFAMTANHCVNPRKSVRIEGARIAPFGLSGAAGVASACLFMAAAAVLLSGCSFDAAFPAVHDMPAARTETLLTPDEIKQSTENLISDRDRLAAMAGGVQR